MESINQHCGQRKRAELVRQSKRHAKTADVIAVGQGAGLLVGTPSLPPHIGGARPITADLATERRGQIWMHGWQLPGSPQSDRGLDGVPAKWVLNGELERWAGFISSTHKVVCKPPDFGAGRADRYHAVRFANAISELQRGIQRLPSSGLAPPPAYQPNHRKGTNPMDCRVFRTCVDNIRQLQGL